MKEYTECDLLKNSTLKNYKCFVMLEPGANNQLWSVAVSHFSQSKITNTPAPCFFFGRYSLLPAVALIRGLPVARATVLRFLPLWFSPFKKNTVAASRLWSRASSKVSFSWNEDTHLSGDLLLVKMMQFALSFCCLRSMMSKNS